MSDFTRGVETVASVLVVNDEGQVLLMRSPKWGETWLVAGGHVDPNEMLKEAAEREGEEELGIKLKAQYLVNVGELIGDPSFHRKAHLVYFHYVCKPLDKDFKLDEREVSEVCWFDPEDALNQPLSEGVRESIQNFIDGVQINVTSKRF